METEDSLFDTCESCQGAGGYDVGDCEDGIWELCEECEGMGYIA